MSARKKVLAFGVAIRERAILDRRCARRRRKSAVGAEESLRRGRTKERARASKKVSEKKCQQEEKVLAFGVAIRERRNGPQVEPRNRPGRLYRCPGHSLTSRKPRPERPPLPIRSCQPNPKRTYDVLPKPDNLISYRQRCLVPVREADTGEGLAGAARPMPILSIYDDQPLQRFRGTIRARPEHPGITPTRSAAYSLFSLITRLPSPMAHR